MANQTDQQYQVIYQENGKGPFRPLQLQENCGKLINQLAWRQQCLAVNLYRFNQTRGLNDRIIITPV